MRELTQTDADELDGFLEEYRNNKAETAARLSALEKQIYPRKPRPTIDVNGVTITERCASVLLHLADKSGEWKFPKHVQQTMYVLRLKKLIRTDHGTAVITVDGLEWIDEFRRLHPHRTLARHAALLD